MKISFIDDEPEIFPLQYGGKARTITSLANSLKKFNEVEQVTILSRSIRHTSSEFLYEGVRFKKLEKYGIARQILEEASSCDVLNVHFCSFTMPYLNDFETILVYHLHDVIFATVDSGSHLDKALGSNWSAIISPSHFASLTLSNLGWWTSLKDRIVTIPRGIDFCTFFPKTKEEGLKSISGFYSALAERISTSYPILFFPNRYKAGKGEELLPELYELMIKKYPNLLIIATSEDAAIQQEIEKIPWIPTQYMKDYYSIADVTIVPTKVPESFSQIPLESIVCGTPVVVFKFGNLTNLVEEIPSIKASKPCCNDLVEIIYSILETSNDTRQSELASSKEIIQNKYNIDIISKRLFEIYKKLPKNSETEQPVITRTFQERRYFLSPLIAKYDNEIFIPERNSNIKRHDLNKVEQELIEFCKVTMPFSMISKKFYEYQQINEVIKVGEEELNG